MGSLEAGSCSTRVDSSICRRFGHIRVTRIVFLLCFLLLLLPFITHYYLSKVSIPYLLLFCHISVDYILPIQLTWIQVESGNHNGDPNRIRFKLEALEDLGALKASDLRLRIQEMERIKGKHFSTFVTITVVSCILLILLTLYFVCIRLCISWASWLGG